MDGTLGRDPATTGCCDSCAAASHAGPVIACSLDAPDFKERIAGIRSLASRAGSRRPAKPAQAAPCLRRRRAGRSRGACREGVRVLQLSGLCPDS